MITWHRSLVQPRRSWLPWGPVQTGWGPPIGSGAFNGRHQVDTIARVGERPMTKGRILLADNNETFIELCARFLKAAGYEVLKAASPEAARQVYETTHLHLAIFDLRMVEG